MEANVSLGELQQKIKRLEGLCQVSVFWFLLLQVWLSQKITIISGGFYQLTVYIADCS